MRWKLLLIFVALIIMESAWAQDELLKKAQTLFKPIPEAFPAPENNPVTPEKIELGKMLYFDPRLSASNLISCNTCHNLGTGGVDLQETSIGHAWQKGPRNAPTVLNSVFNIAQFWDGRAKDLAEQAKGPVQANVEMNNTPERVVVTLKSMPEYVDLFKKSFPGEKDSVNFDNTVKAIEAFEATLLTPNSRFDKYIQGEANALNAEEKEGLRLFMDKGCTTCHNGVNIGGSGYFPFGVVKRPGADILPPGDKGRFMVTKTASDEYVFKVPTLRNIELTTPYFHSGTVWSLREAVAVMGSAQLGIELTDEDVTKITAFLRTLTGEQPSVEYPILPSNRENTPRPILDISGREDAAH
ncbi:MAG TPA: cytochrome-c peroxidase [Thermodesulfobacteriota bacterium]|nr:cytochrome-c peroxidase [Thermodesulfobacteriota bacterium]